MINRRCQYTDPTGKACRGFTSRYDADFCIFHSKNPEVKRILEEARRRAWATPKVRRSRREIKNIFDVLNALNELYRNSRTVREKIEVLSEFLKFFKTKSELIDLEKLKRELERIEEGQPKEDVDRVVYETRITEEENKEENTE